MAAPMEGRNLAPRIYNMLTYSNMLHVRQMSFINKLKFFQRKKESEKEEAVVSVEGKENLIEEMPKELRTRVSIEEKRSYQPPAEAGKIIQAITYDVFSLSDNNLEDKEVSLSDNNLKDKEDIDTQKTDWLNIQLDDRVQKFNLLTRVMEELNHDIASVDLNDMNSLADVVKYFSLEVKDTSVLEDLTKLDLPKNLHMNLEYIRFHPDTDKIFDGVTAFPGQATKVTSIKYKRKYKGFDGGDPVNYPDKIIGNV